MIIGETNKQKVIDGLRQKNSELFTLIAALLIKEGGAVTVSMADMVRAPENYRACKLNVVRNGNVLRISLDKGPAEAQTRLVVPAGGVILPN